MSTHIDGILLLASKKIRYIKIYVLCHIWTYVLSILFHMLCWSELSFWWEKIDRRSSCFNLNWNKHPNKHQSPHIPQESRASKNLSNFPSWQVSARFHVLTVVKEGQKTPGVVAIVSSTRLPDLCTALRWYMPLLCLHAVICAYIVWYSPYFIYVYCEPW